MNSNESTYDRRAFPICKPYGCERGAEYRRFAREFLAGAQSIDADDNFSIDEVLLGTHQGGDDPSAAAATTQQATRSCARRNKKAAGILQKYILDERLRTLLVTEHGGNGRDMWKRLKTECDEPPDEQSVAVLKKEITSATILQTVGFKHNSISSFKLHLDKREDRAGERSRVRARPLRRDARRHRRRHPPPEARRAATSSP